MNNKDKTLKLNYNIILYGLIGLFILIGLILIITNINKKKEITKLDEQDELIEVDEVKYKDTISNIENINSKIDLNSIFLTNDVHFNTILDGNTIYYFYNPVSCYNSRKDRLDLEERINNCVKEQKTKCTDETSGRADCQENYCRDYFTSLNDLLDTNESTNNAPICELFDPNNDKEYDELNKIYLVSQDITSNNFNILDTFDLNTNESLDVITDKNLYYSITNNNSILSKKIDKLTNNINILKSNYKTVKYNDNPYLIGKSGNNYTIGKYDEEKNSIINEEVTLHGDNYAIDKYTDDFYSYANNKIYKNSIIIHMLSEDKNIKAVFATYQYIYVIYDNNSNLEMLKLRKKDNSVLETIKILQPMDEIKYKFINSNSEPIFIIDNSLVYTFDEKEKTFEEIYTIKSDSDIETFHNYLIYMNDEDLYIYNTITNEEKIYNDIHSYYLNTNINKIYMLVNNNKLSLKYIDID